MIKTKKLAAIGVLTCFALVLLSSFAQSARDQEVALTNIAPSNEPVHVSVGIWLVNIEKVDLPSSSYRVDCYLWFSFNPSEISLDNVRNFEFVNGQPTKYEVDANNDSGYLEYRIKGDFITSFDFTNYPFESHDLTIELEHKNLNMSSLVYDLDLEGSAIEPTASVAGWNLGGFNASIAQHSYGGDIYSRPTFSVTITRPLVSAVIKSVLPVSVITAISLLAFFMSPQNFAQRITLAVTTLLAATTFHLALLSGIPPTGYLTFADRIMISVYVIFLFNMAASVFIMRLVDAKKMDEASKLKRKSMLFLPVLVIILIAAQMVL
jgi:hypothetical protein